jgi:hypothetical protein
MFTHTPVIEESGHPRTLTFSKAKLAFFASCMIYTTYIVVVLRLWESSAKCQEAFPWHFSYHRDIQKFHPEITYRDIFMTSSHAINRRRPPFRTSITQPRGQRPFPQQVTVISYTTQQYYRARYIKDRGHTNHHNVKAKGCKLNT